MSDTKFTPGPWRCVEQDDVMIAKVYGPPHPVDGGNYAALFETSDKANARLIAAAPDMYKALMGLNLQAPAADALCHRDICPQEKCANCQRINAALDALDKAVGK